jgi:hypothetical protein
VIGKLMGAWIGNRIDRRDGEGGVKGAILGTLAVGALRRAGPIGLVVGGAYLAKRMFDRRRGDITR